MQRAIPFFGLLVIVSLVIYLFVDRLGYKFQLGSFINGILALGITGFVYFLITGWWSKVRDPYKPVVATVKTDKVPAKIALAGTIELIKGIFFFVVFVIFVALVFKLVF